MEFIEVNTYHVFSFHTFEPIRASDFIDELAEVFQKNATITKNSFYSEVSFGKDRLSIKTNFSVKDLILGEYSINLHLSGSFTTLKIDEKNRRFKMWEKMVVNSFSNITLKKSSVFFNDYKWLIE